MDVRQRFPAGHAEYSKGHRKDDLEKREVPPLRERVVAEGVDVLSEDSTGGGPDLGFSMAA